MSSIPIQNLVKQKLLNPHPSPCSPLVIFIFRACERHGSIFLATRLV